MPVGSQCLTSSAVGSDDQNEGVNLLKTFASHRDVSFMRQLKLVMLNASIFVGSVFGFYFSVL